MTSEDVEPRRANTGALLTALVLVIVVVQLCNSMLTPALPDMAERLGTDPESIGFAQAMYYLVSGLVAIGFASYCDHTWRHRLILISLAVTVLGLLVAAAAPNLAVLVVGRVLQGASGALFPLVLRVLRETVPLDQFGRATGVVTAAYAGATGVDVIIGGWLTDTYGFRAVLVFMTVVTVIAAVVSARVLPTLPPTSTGRMDRLGTVLLCLSLTAIQVGVGLSEDSGYGTAAIFVGAGFALFAAFWAVEKRQEEPLIPVTYLRSRQAWPVVATSALTFAGMLSVINYTIPILSQDPDAGYANSATVTSLIFLVPLAAINLFVSPIAGTIAPRIGWHHALRAALAGCVPVLILLAIGHRSEGLAITMIVVLGVCNAVALTAINGLSVMLAPDRNRAVLPGMNSTAFAVGASLGITLASQLVGNSPTSDPSSTIGFQQALWMSAAVSAAAFLVSLAVPRPESVAIEKV